MSLKFTQMSPVIYLSGNEYDLKRNFCREKTIPFDTFLIGSDDDVVKLYDLTALCDSTKATDENPFMVPIGMLLYRVARNMWTNFRHRKAPVIRTLLENCLFLLDEEKHSQV